MKLFLTIIVLTISGIVFTSAHGIDGSSTETTLCEPIDAISIPRELQVAQMDPWAPLDSISRSDDPTIPPQLRVREYADAFDVLAPADDTVDPSFEETRRQGVIMGSGHFRCAILMYHGFHDPPRTIYEISTYDFEQQCRFLSESGVDVIPLATLIDALTTKEYSMVPDRCVVITVDDGYHNFYTGARPILKKYSFPATMNVYTDFIGAGKGALSWDEIREMIGEGWLEIEDHSLSHPNLNRSKGRFPSYGDWLHREIVSSRIIIENHTGQPVKAFTYPYGTYNSSADSIVRNGGFDAALTVHPGPVTPETDPYVLPRYGIYRDCSLSKFARFVQGGQADPDELKLYMNDADSETMPAQ